MDPLQNLYSHPFLPSAWVKFKALFISSSYTMCQLGISLYSYMTHALSWFAKDQNNILPVVQVKLKSGKKVTPMQC